ncbi:TetR/AcrR family transcriptional regulator [Streptomyces sp. KM273126]|uniref:TetR/AcrR family transcriptional regulator n=1 Tax=Streptomyces sp. KM273126 TaxID=2545247 RepID=UPI0028681DC7|nr:TetR/AcrR family transcriptional regulator [Streptomyces sp. KM273126]
MHGPEVGMDEIAAAAAVAVGTLYRHFPDKADLVAAVVAEHLEGVAAEAAVARVASGARATDEITGFLERVVEASAADHAVKAAALALGADPAGEATVERAAGALATLIRAGQADGDIHPDVTIDDMYLLISTAPAEQAPAARARRLTLLLPGLTTRARSVDD